MRDKDGKPNPLRQGFAGHGGMKPKHIKCEPKPYATPEEVAAHESMKPGYGTAGINPYPKKKEHKLKHSTPPVTQPKLFDDPIYSMDIFTLRDIPKSDMFIEQIAAKLVTWVLTEPDKKLVFDKFLREIGYEDTSFYNFMKRSKKLKAAYNFALMSIGVTREEGMLLNKLNASGVMNSMPSYSKRWKDLAEWRAKINKQNEVDNSTKVVVIERYAKDVKDKK